jgi:hypothetical protein
MKQISLIICIVLSLTSLHAQVADQIAVINDQTTVETPSNFTREVRFKFKYNNSIGLPSGTGSYSALMSIAPWSDDTGGPNHQINFNQQGLYWRQGLRSSGWGSWKKIITDDGNGNVGIGTASPSEKLEIVNSGSSVALKVRHATEHASWGISIMQSDNLSGLIACNGRDFKIEPGWDKTLTLGSPEMTGGGGKVIFPGGNVGIGTLNPDAKLTVKGTIHANEVRVDLNVAGPDYVFEPTYHLKPLSEIETYIKANKHLPEVPSAKEMEANGVQLGEMNMLLLKKVEELTLYVIELKKENESVKQVVTEVNDLKRQIESIKTKLN